MKKTLVAIAALAVVGAASAQSSVTLYGRIDAGLGDSKTTTTTAAGVSTTAPHSVTMNSGNATSSRWGMRGSEDLGGGLKANFRLESAISADTGVGVAGFTRTSTLGLSGGFGSVELGRQFTAYDNSLSYADPAGYGNFGGIGLAYAAGIHADGARQNNSINYFTPAMGPFAAQVTYAFQENVTAASNQSKYWGFNTTYGQGPLKVSFGYEALDIIPGAGLTTDAWALAASYNLGVANIGFGLEQAKQKGLAANGKDRGWNIGASVPVGPATLQASYGREKTTGLGAANSETKGGGLYVSYALSKRTSVYGGWATVKTDTVNSLVGSKTSKWGTGMIHNF